MHIEAYREYCLKKPGTSESLPFDNNTLVFKVMGKMFALCDVDKFQSINLKCDPEYALELRERFQSVNPGYHMNKQHWNTIDSNGDVPDKLLYEFIDHSYELIVKSLPKKVQKELSEQPN